MPGATRRDDLDPLPYTTEWPSLRSATGRVDIHSLAAFWVRETKVRGAYLEFGVGKGRSAVAAIRAHLRDNPGTVAPFVLFDSFCGLPELTSLDTGSNQFRPGDFAFSMEQVRAFLREHGIPASAPVTLVPGWFEQSLPGFDLAAHGVQKAAMVHIDVDLYASCGVVLRFIRPLLQAGTILLFDDWNAFGASDRKGERAATAEWLLQNPVIRLNEYASYGWHGKAFIVDLLEA
ncbi:MAG: class I SAM-dependent methyltransferase [Verrucomicrobiales bacterium]|nr:class I SAM-dependent methyltransferase [Verrucomicrobiales bacterium]